MNADSPYQAGPDYLFGCTFIAVVDRYLCVLDPDGANSSLFLFEPLIREHASGTFEFCDGLSTSDCSNELYFAADGPVEVTVTPMATRAVQSFSGAADPGFDSALPYLQYLEQGSPGIDSGYSVPVDRGIYKATAAVAEALKYKE